MKIKLLNSIFHKLNEIGGYPSNEEPISFLVHNKTYLLSMVLNSKIKFFFFFLTTLEKQTLTS